MKHLRWAAPLLAAASIAAPGAAAARGFDAGQSFDELLREVVEWRLDVMPHDVDRDRDEGAQRLAGWHRADVAHAFIQSWRHHGGRDDGPWARWHDWRSDRGQHDWRDRSDWRDWHHDRGHHWFDAPCLPVPEPGSAALMLGGLATLIGLRRRRGTSGPQA